MFDWQSALDELHTIEHNNVPLSWFIEICEIADPNHPRNANRVVFDKENTQGFLTLLQYAQRYNLQVGIRSVNLLDYNITYGTAPTSNKENEIVVVFDKTGEMGLVLDRNNHDEIGRMLGVPVCCRRAFIDLSQFDIPEGDPRWTQHAIDDAIKRNVFDFHWAFNPTASYMRFCPCKYDCDAAFEAIKRYIPPSHPRLTPVYSSLEIQGHIFNFTLDVLN